MIPLQKYFKVNEIKSNMIKTISDKELLNMHRRIHQLYNAPHPPNKKELEKKHDLIVKEMERRKMSHKSALNESLLYEYGQTARFVIHLHLAKKAGRHFDFRLEHNNVLKSWAVRNLDQLINQSKNKVLAVQVEDHPLDYIDFQGEIKDGYGAGEVSIWDSGSFKIVSWSNSKIVFEIFGKKMKGKFALVRTGGDKFLLVKMKE